jgi:hypothetical protein
MLLCLFCYCALVIFFLKSLIISYLTNVIFGSIIIAKVLLCFIMQVHDSLMGLALDWVLRYYLFLLL